MGKPLRIDQQIHHQTQNQRSSAPHGPGRATLGGNIWLLTQTVPFHRQERAILPHLPLPLQAQDRPQIAVESAARH